MKAHVRQYSLQFTIATLVVFLLLATVVGVLVIGLFVREKAINATAEALQGEVSARITERFVERFGSVPNLLHGLAEGVEGGRLPTTDDALLESLADRMRFEDRVEWLAWIRPDGTGCGIVADKRGLLALRLGADLQAQVDIWQEDGTRTPAPARVRKMKQLDGWIGDILKEVDTLGLPALLCRPNHRSILSHVRSFSPHLHRLRRSKHCARHWPESVVGLPRGVLSWPTMPGVRKWGAKIPKRVDYSAALATGGRFRGSLGVGLAS